MSKEGGDISPGNMEGGELTIGLKLYGAEEGL